MGFPVNAVLRLLLITTIVLGGSVFAVEPESLQQSLSLALDSAMTYREQRDCFSCHHQALPLMAAAEFKRLKGKLSAELKTQVTAQAEFIREYFHGRIERLTKGEGVPGGAYTAGYALAGLKAADHLPDETTAALVTYLEKTQRPDGSWRIGTHRPPLEDSHFTATALAVYGLQTWFVASVKAGPDRIRSAVEWLTKTKAQTNEDYTFKLLGLYWAEADADEIRRAADELRALSRTGGGWGQTKDLESDPYATGQALYALVATKMLSPREELYERVSHWLTTQRQADGSWRVKSRSKPIQKYFESGFPHEKDQFISIAASCFSVMALASGDAIPAEK